MLPPTFTLLASILLASPVLGRGGGRGGGGSSGGGGGGAGGGTTTIEYTVEECYTVHLGAVYMFGNETTDGSQLGNCTKLTSSSNYCYWVWDDAHNNSTRNFLTENAPDRPTTSWEMEIYDAYYNGSFSLTLTPPPANQTYDCPELKSQEIPNMFLRLGSQSRGNVSRNSYGDKNPYYFHFGRSIFEQDCPQTPNKAFVNFESSNDNLQHSQIWTLNQKKNGDKFEIDGSLTSQYGSYNNYFNYVVNTTGTDAGYPTAKGCPKNFQLRSLLANSAAKMNATVTATDAELSFSFTDTEKQWKITGTFHGKHWDKGAKVLFDKDSINTEGQSEHVKPRAPKDKRLWMDKYGKYVYIAIALVVLVGIIYVLWHCAAAVFSLILCCFPCCSRKKREERAHKKAMKEQMKAVNNSPDQSYGSPQFTYADKNGVTETVTSVTPHDPRDSETNYAVTPTVMQSYFVRGGKYLVEIANTQMELHKAHKELKNAGMRGDNDGVSFHSAMVQHHTAVIEHYMTLRAAGV